ncbi:MAG: hypothetical protein AAGH15_03535 [Myxococcota bacterium]
MAIACADAALEPRPPATAVVAPGASFGELVVHDVTPVDSPLRALTEADVVERTPAPVGAVGLVVDPETGYRLVVRRSGEVLIASTDEVVQVFEAPERRFGFGDAVWVGPGLLALTALNDGFLAVLSTGELTQHFCFLPTWMEPQFDAIVQRSDALALDRTHDRLYAQPQTDGETEAGTVLEGFLSSYALSDGAERTWYRMPRPVPRATGMVVLSPGPGDGERDAPRLLLAYPATLSRGPHLQIFDGEAATLTPSVDLTSIDVGHVGALAVDEAAETLLVLATQEIVALPLALFRNE